ncbi:MAG: acyltransferase [Chitinophagaceae bacterium]|nr:MAG: acyltransferase [Chitinophagaceae bacterium]
MDKKIAYFPNLNGIRFILACLVLLHHVAVVLYANGFSNLYLKVNALKAFGPVAVSLFFCLSGFLITYLLLQENKITGTISIKSFYKKRIKRIFPLYYLIVIIHLFILPHTALISLDEKLTLGNIGGYAYSTISISNFWINSLYLSLLPQFALALMVASGNNYVPAGHVWSIGVEEIFYILYPILLKKNTHIFKKFIFSLIAIYYFIAISIFIIIQVSKNTSIENSSFMRLLNASIIIVIYNRVVCMFIGAIGAYLFIHKHKYLKYFTNQYFFIGSLAGILFLFSIGARVPFLTHEVYCIFFLSMLLFLIKDNKSYFLENKYVSYFGKISYGIYMYQMIAILIVVYVVKKNDINIFFVYPLSFILTIFMSFISYEYFEKKILFYNKQSENSI